SFVHRPADAVAGVIANDAVTVRFSVLLNGPANIADAVAGNALGNAEFQAFFGYADELRKFVGYLADRNGYRCVADKPLIRCRQVDRHDIAGLERSFFRKTVNDLIIYGGAYRVRKTVITD